MAKKIAVIILSGGSGERFDKNKPKQLFSIGNETLLDINIRKFLSVRQINNIVIVHSKKISKDVRKLKNKNIFLTLGGTTRQASVKSGLNFAKKLEPDVVLIHDCARPFVEKELIKNLIANTTLSCGCIPVLKINDSIKYIDFKKSESRGISRENIYQIQTPQSFPFKKILNAHNKSSQNDFTDDSGLAEENGIHVKYILGDKKNIKITDKDDIKFVKLMLFDQKEISVGTGFDVHGFEDGKYIIICGVKIPFNKKLKGHSDADVGFHTVVDAILGSIREGDIGEHFPPSEKKWKDVPSSIFIKFAKDKVKEKNANIKNIDLTIICEEPKMFKYKIKMKKNLSKLLEIDEERINVKATTTEKLGFLGRGEGVAVQAAVTCEIFTKNG
tara:strand:- start:1174 stop:2334 length:1161 start_codon:yes stop_codon:yes gene_type:complete